MATCSGAVAGQGRTALLMSTVLDMLAGPRECVDCACQKVHFMEEDGYTALQVWLPRHLVA